MKNTILILLCAFGTFLNADTIGSGEATAQFAASPAGRFSLADGSWQGKGQTWNDDRTKFYSCSQVQAKAVPLNRACKGEFGDKGQAYTLTTSCTDPDLSKIGDALFYSINEVCQINSASQVDDSHVVYGTSINLGDNGQGHIGDFSYFVTLDSKSALSDSAVPTSMHFERNRISGASSANSLQHLELDLQAAD